MRSIAVAIFIFAALPFVFRRPYLGILLWVWVSVMNPHRLTWGFAYSFSFAYIVAIVTILSGVLSKEPKQFPVGPITVALIALVFWMNISPLFPLNGGDDMYAAWINVTKVFLMTFFTIWLLQSRQHVHWLICTLAFSIGYFGTKGGLFTLLTGGGFQVWGPPGSFIEDNNKLAVAVVMVIPLIYYVYLTSKHYWLRWGLRGAMVLCAASALGSQSRGAMLALCATGAMLWYKSSHKLAVGLALLLLVPAALIVMPDSWKSRMQTIETYEQDSSASHRLVAWEEMFNVAKDRLPIGGGYELATQGIWNRYSPSPGSPLVVAHSSYFQMLGEHGFVGLTLFLSALLAAWSTGNWIRRKTRDREEWRWAFDLASMIQVSLVGYMVGGAFLDMTYFDVTFYLLAALAVTRALVEKELRHHASPVNDNPASRVTPLPASADTIAFTRK